MAATNSHKFLHRTFSSYGTTAHLLQENDREDNYNLLLKAFCVLLGVAVLCGIIAATGYIVKLYTTDPDPADTEAIEFFLKHAGIQNNRSFRKKVDT